MRTKRPVTDWNVLSQAICVIETNVMKKGGVMKIVSWNVNGLNACIRKRGFDQLIDLLPDVICLQETKVKKEVEVISGYNHYFVCSPRNSYSGCLIMTLDEPQNILYGMGNEKFDEEARVIVAEYPDFFIVREVCSGLSGRSITENM